MPDHLAEEARRLIDEYRERCLWFLRSDYYPKGRAETLRVLEYVERYGDREGFRRAAEIRQWLRERSGLVEARVSRGPDAVTVEWARDSAFRFFPLVEHSDLGLVLHPFDLATNKVLALVGRLEPRDWIDVIECDGRLQPLGYLAWAASGKDPGFSPKSILEEAARGARCSEVEIRTLDFAGDAPEAAELSRRWHRILNTARRVVDALPAAHVGECVLTGTNALCHAEPAALADELRNERIRFHAGSIRGALPDVR